ncbi:DUF2523 family protein [Roseateles sp. NT4]
MVERAPADARPHLHGAERAWRPGHRLQRLTVPLFLGALIGALISAAGTLVGRVLLSLGIGYASYSGIDAGL